eukprot:COSAG04_NODE_9858_length_827_cov_0.682692_1_plen_81_part_00
MLGSSAATAGVLSPARRPSRSTLKISAGLPDAAASRSRAHSASLSSAALRSAAAAFLAAAAAFFSSFCSSLRRAASAFRC